MLQLLCILDEENFYNGHTVCPKSLVQFSYSLNIIGQARTFELTVTDMLVHHCEQCTYISTMTVRREHISSYMIDYYSKTITLKGKNL